MKLYIFFMLLIATPALSQPLTPDLNMAKRLYDEGEYLESLKIVGPCLKKENYNAFQNLAECLVLGDAIEEKAIEELEGKFYEITKGKIGNWEPAKILFDLGINPKVDHWGEVFSDKPFIHKLSELFPNTSYGEYYDYRLMQPGGDALSAVRRWLNDLERYRINYPGGKYYLDATFDLGMIYHNLWWFTHPDYADEYMQFSHGMSRTKDREKLILLSDEYRETSLLYLKEILTYKTKGTDKPDSFFDKIEYSLNEVLDKSQPTIIVHSKD